MVLKTTQALLLTVPSREAFCKGIPCANSPLLNGLSDRWLQNLFPGTQAGPPRRSKQAHPLKCRLPKNSHAFGGAVGDGLQASTA